jgi:hypothetical protein
VLFFGSDAFALESLRAVLGAPGLVQQLQVVCPPDNRPAKSKSAVPGTVCGAPFVASFVAALGTAAFLKAEAAKLGLTVHQTSSTTDFRMTGWEVRTLCVLRRARHTWPMAPLRCLQLPAHPDGQPWDLGVVVSFGYFIPRGIIEQFRFGMINVHASLLPKYQSLSLRAWL